MNRYSRSSVIAFKVLLTLLFILYPLLPVTTVYAASKIASVSGNWSNTATWGGAAVPVAGDTITINSGITVTVDTAAVCGTVTFAAATASSLITISGTNSLTVTGLISMPRPSPPSFTVTIAVGAGTLSAGSLTMNATTAGRNNILSISTGSATISGALTTGAAGCQFIFTGTGTLTFGGTTTVGLSTMTTVAGSTVRYSNTGAQTVIRGTYNNLILAGSGVKTTTTVTVNSILSMEGTATASAAPTYGAAATLQYNSTHTAGAEWITPFVASGGVIINTGTITLNAAKVFNATAPLSINSGATLAMSTFLLTLNGNLVNNGGTTSGSGGVTITGTATQSIGAFTTTGTVSMTKTGGTATFTGNVNGNAFTLSGSGGTLNLGTGLTHTFTGSWTRSNGTLLGNSSTLKIFGNVTNTAGTFTAGTGTVNYNGAAQTIANVTYNNLTLSGSGIKTTTGATVTGILSMEETATAGAAPTYGAAVTLQYKGSGVQTTGPEFVTPWLGTGGIKIENASGVTLNAVKTINATSSLTIGSTVGNSVFNDGGFQLTSTGALNLTSGIFKLGSAGTATIFPAFGTINISAGATVEYAAGVVQTVSSIPAYQNLTVSGNSIKTTGGAMTVNGNLTIGTGTTLDVSANNYSMIVKGNWSNSGTFTARSGTVTLGGLTTQAISGSATTSFCNLTVNNVNGVTLNVSPAVSGTLTLTSGIITTGANTLIIATGGSISGASNSSYVNGNLQKAFNSGAGQSFSFTIGDASAYVPVTIASMNVGTGGTLTVFVTGGEHPNIATSDLDVTMNINRYWTLISGGGFAATYNATFNYLSSDLDGGAIASAFFVRRYSSGAWSPSTVSGSPTTTITTISGETGFGAFAVGNTRSVPTVSTVALYQTDHATTVTAMSPQTEYAIKVSVSNAATLAILSTVKVTIFYDADGIYAAGDVPSSGNTQTAAILTCTIGSTPSWSIDPGLNTTWSIVSANCIQPILTNTTGDFWFHFKAGKVATTTTGSSRWHIYAKANSSGGTASNYESNRTMNWYGEIIVNTSSINFGTVGLGSDFSANSQTSISVTYVCNGNYSEQVKVSSPWTGDVYLVPLNAAGAPDVGEFSLKAGNTATLGSAVLVSTGYITIGTGTQTSETGNTVTANTVWLKLGVSGLPAVTYNGTIYYAITQ